MKPLIETRDGWGLLAEIERLNSELDNAKHPRGRPRLNTDLPFTIAFLAALYQRHTGMKAEQPAFTGGLRLIRDGTFAALVRDFLAATGNSTSKPEERVHKLIGQARHKAPDYFM
jgi:hypothetical protein